MGGRLPVRFAVTAIISLYTPIAGQTVRAQETPKLETLQLRLESFALGLDPAFIADTQSRRIDDMLHAKLIRGDPDGHFDGEIADSWSWTAATTLRIHLRSGLTFANGQTLTAEDAAFSICRLLQPGAPYAWLFSNVKHVLDPDQKKADCSGIRVADQFTLEIEVTGSPDRLLPALATTSAAIIPREATPGDYGSVPGAGPFALEEIAPNSRVVLKARKGGPLQPHTARVVFQFVPDDPAAAALYGAGQLDVLEISNPTLYRLMIDDRGDLRLPGRLIKKDVDQIRLLLFNWDAIGQTLGLTKETAASWTKQFGSSMDLNAIVKRFDPLLIPMPTSYFPARGEARRPVFQGQYTTSEGLTIITENDPYSDAIAAAVASSAGKVKLSYVGLTKAVLISRLIKREYQMASITLEAMMHHPAYWLSFFTPGSPFTTFGTSIDGLSDSSAAAEVIRDAHLIDEGGNWFALAQERRLIALRPGITGEAFHPTGLLNYAGIGLR
jgi:hypothetical protein